MKRRVVITGLGGVTPIGNDLETIFKNLENGYCGIDEITNFDTKNHKVKLAGQVKDLDLNDYLDRKSQRRMDKVNQFGIVAAKKAVENSKLDLETIDKSRVGVYVSSGIGGLQTIENEHSKGLERTFDKISPFFIPMSITNLTASHIAIEFGFHGDCNCPVTACAGGTTAIGEAFRNIKDGYLDIVLAGGSEASITELGIGGFTSMYALNENPDKNRASIPFDKERAGFVMGEGAGILVLEEYSHAIGRGAKIYGELVGYGVTCDANHITAPNEEGYWAGKAMEMAMLSGDIDPKDIAYINAHGTSTPLNDKCETRAIKNTFKDHAYDLNVSSTKSMTGHLLGASGAVEAIITTLALERGYIPPTINYVNKDEDCDLNITPNKGIYKEIEYAMSNSLGFGGHNASIIIKKWSE